MIHDLIGWIHNLTLERILIAASIVPLAFMSERLLIFLGQRYLLRKKWIFSQTDFKDHQGVSLFWLVLLFLLQISLPFLMEREPYLSRLQNLLSIILILVAAWVITRTLSLAKIAIFSHLDITRADNLRARRLRTQIQFLQKIIIFFVYFISLACILMRFEAVRKFGGSLIASAGLAGVVLGFAAQKSLANLFSGFQIAFTQPIRIDDVVIVEGEWGRIEEITFTYVVMRLWDKRALIVPISYFLEKPFQNWTRVSADLLGVVMIYVDYHMPLQPLRDEFQKILKSCPLWDGKISGVQVTDSTKSGIEIRFLAGARNSSEAFDLRCIIREQLIDMIQKNYPECLPQQRVINRNVIASSPNLS